MLNMPGRHGSNTLLLAAAAPHDPATSAYGLPRSVTDIVRERGGDIVRRRSGPDTGGAPLPSQPTQRRQPHHHPHQPASAEPGASAQQAPRHANIGHIGQQQQHAAQPDQRGGVVDAGQPRPSARKGRRQAGRTILPSSLRVPSEPGSTQGKGGESESGAFTSSGDVDEGMLTSGSEDDGEGGGGGGGAMVGTARARQFRGVTLSDYDHDPGGPGSSRQSSNV